MANVIKLKRGSGSDPGANDLVVGEVAIRTDSGKLFTKKDNGSIAEISGSGGGASNFFINTLSSSSGSGGGSASFNGSATRFTLSNPPSVSAQQLLVSVNGVIQKPNSGTSPSEGFAIDGDDIIFAAAPATGADFFIITYAELAVGVPSDNSVTSAKIADLTIVNGDISNTAAIAGTKVSPNFGSQNITTTGNLTIDTNTLHVDSSNNRVGIGTTSPDAPLTIHNSSDPEIRFGYSSSQDHRLAWDSSKVFLHADPENANSNSALGLSVDGSTRLYITDAGNVGIGTTSPNALLDVNGQARFGGNKVTLDTDGSITQKISNSTTRAFMLSNTDVSADFFGGRVYQIWNDGTVMIGGSAGTNPASYSTPKIQFNPVGNSFFNASGGNVGIGTTSPDLPLHVNGTSNADEKKLFRLTNAGGSPGTTAVMEFECGVDEIATISANNAGGDIGNLMFGTATSQGAYPTEKMRINSNGDIMAGRTSVFSGARLSLEKSGTCLGIRQAANADNNSIEMTHLYATSASYQGFQISFRDASGNQRGSITNNTSTTSYNTSSDYRLKENEVLISDGITRLKTLKPYKFNWKSDSSTIVDGFFAHEVSDAVPEAVIGEKDATVGEDGKGYQQIDHSKLVPLLTAALQEAIVRIEALEAG